MQVGHLASFISCWTFLSELALGHFLLSPRPGNPWCGTRRGAATQELEEIGPRPLPPPLTGVGELRERERTVVVV